MTNEIRVYALSNGMEVIGTQVSEDETTIRLENALVVNLQPKPNTTEYDVNLIPPTFFAHTGDDGGRKGIDLTLYKNVLLFNYQLREDLKQRYTLQTGKIIIASALR